MTNALFVLAFGILSFAVWQHQSQQIVEQSYDSFPVDSGPPESDLVELTVDVEPPPEEPGTEFELSPDEWMQVRRAADEQNLSIPDYVKSRLFQDISDSLEIEQSEENC